MYVLKLLIILFTFSQLNCVIAYNPHNLKNNINDNINTAVNVNSIQFNFDVNSNSFVNDSHIREEGLTERSETSDSTKIEEKRCNKIKMKKNAKQNSSKKNHTQNLKVLHWNCNSIKNKFKYLEQYLHENKIDIVSINELKCDDELWNDIYNLPTYKKVNKCRNNSGGGVALLIKNNIEFEIVELEDAIKNLEIVGIKIGYENENLFVYSWYIPDQSLEKDMIDLVIKDRKNILIIGDLNARTIQFNESTNNNGIELDNYMLNNNLMYLNSNKDYTFCRYNSITQTETKSVLDYFIANVEIGNRSSNYKTIKFEILDSDHVPIYVEIEMEKNLIENSPASIKRNYKKTEWKIFRESNDKKMIKTSDSLNREEVEIKIHELETNINWSLDESTPKIKKVFNRQPLPIEILKILKIKKSLMKIFYETRKSTEPDTIIKGLYYTTKNYIKEKIIELKNEIWQKELDSYKGQPLSSKKFWNKINKMRGLKTKNPISNLKFENKIWKTNKEKATVFKERLKNTFCEAKNSNFNEEYKTEISNFVKRYKQNQIIQETNKISKEEFTLALLEITKKYTEDEYKISNGTLKQLSDKYKDNVLDIYNSMLKLNFIPVKWKVAKITMLPKTSNDSSNPKNYRPISITPSLMRLYEKIINNRIKKWLSENNIIIKQQSGFRQHRQTKDNLFFLIEKINESMHRSRKSVSIYFDIAAAFDKVWHEGLIYKLIKIHMPPYLINWIVEFLNNRQFYVVVENIASEKTEIQCGVPQGAINSPILFSLYINDVPTNCKKNSRYSLLFADDLAKLYIFKKVCTDKTIEKEINLDLKHLEQWCSKWRLEIAAAKCMFLKHNYNNATVKYKINNINIYMYGNEIPNEPETKFLGIKIDESLKFASHINKIEASCLNRVNILKILSHKSWKLNSITLVNIYKSLIRSIMEYSCILVPMIKNELLNKLTIIQNNCMRIIRGVNLTDRVRISELEKLCNIENLKNRLDKLRLRYIYKSLFLDNPLVNEIMADHKNYTGGRNISHRTLFEKVKSWDEIDIE
jgi:hypothetical protein